MAHNKQAIILREETVNGVNVIKPFFVGEIIHFTSESMQLYGVGETYNGKPHLFKALRKNGRIVSKQNLRIVDINFKFQDTNNINYDIIEINKMIATYVENCLSYHAV